MAALTKNEIRSLARSAGGSVVVASTAESKEAFRAFNYTIDARKFHSRYGLPVAIATATGIFVFASFTGLKDEDYLESFVAMAAKLGVTKVTSFIDD